MQNRKLTKKQQERFYINFSRPPSFYQDIKQETAKEIELNINRAKKGFNLKIGKILIKGRKIRYVAKEQKYQNTIDKKVEVDEIVTDDIQYPEIDLDDIGFAKLYESLIEDQKKLIKYYLLGYTTNEMIEEINSGVAPDRILTKNQIKKLLKLTFRYFKMMIERESLIEIKKRWERDNV